MSYHCRPIVLVNIIYCIDHTTLKFYLIYLILSPFCFHSVHVEIFTICIQLINLSGGLVCHRKIPNHRHTLNRPDQILVISSRKTYLLQAFRLVFHTF